MPTNAELLLKYVEEVGKDDYARTLNSLRLTPAQYIDIVENDVTPSIGQQDAIQATTSRRWSGRGGIVAGSWAPPVPASPADWSPYYYLRQAGITAVSGSVASWDAIGVEADRLAALDPPQGLRFEPILTSERPLLVTAGALRGAQCTSSGSHLRSTTSLSLGQASIATCTVRMDAWLNSDRIYEMASLGYFVTSVAGLNTNIRVENGTNDLITTGKTYDVGEILTLTVKLATTGGTSQLFVNGVLEDTAPGSANTYNARPVGLGARPTDGAVSCDVTHFDAAQFTFADNAEADAFDMNALHEWGAYLREQAVV